MSISARRLLSMNTMSNGKTKITCHGILLNMLISRFVVLSLHLNSILSSIQYNNVRNTSCVMPTFWQDDGTIVQVTANGCMASDFDQYGDMEAFGVHPDWQRQLSKFASVQDRLREWNPNVMERIQNFACLVIKALDIDAIRIDKSTQVTVDALTEWTSNTRACAAQLNKTNFLITGEVTGGDTFGSIY